MHAPETNNEIGTENINFLNNCWAMITGLQATQNGFAGFSTKKRSAAYKTRNVSQAAKPVCSRNMTR